MDWQGGTKLYNLCSSIYAELFELAGDLSQRLQQPEAAIAMYQRGGAFARSIELARTVQPEMVTVLEEEWGDWWV